MAEVIEAIPIIAASIIVLSSYTHGIYEATLNIDDYYTYYRKSPTFDYGECMAWAFNGFCNGLLTGFIKPILIPFEIYYFIKDDSNEK